MQEYEFPMEMHLLDSYHLRKFFIYLQEEQRWGGGTPSARKCLNQGGIAAYARAVKAFLNWACIEAGLEKNPLQNMRLPSGRKEWKVEVYNDAEIVRIFQVAGEAHTPFIAARNRLILALLFDTGLRASELLSLRVGQVTPAMNCFTIVGKGNRERVLPLSGFVRAELASYLALRHESSGWLLLTHHGIPLSYWGLRTMFSRLQNKCGPLHINIYAHAMRHTAATKMHRNGMRLSSLQQILGHAKFDTTKSYYLNIEQDEMLEEHAKYSPMQGLSRELHKPSPGLLPEKERLRKEVQATSLRSVAAKYGVSHTTVANYLKK